MAQVTYGLRAILSNPVVYSTLQSLMGAHQGRTSFVADFVKPVAGVAVLDVGCGPAEILDYLPAVDYWGFDISQEYIAHAVKKFSSKGRFFHKLLAMDDLASMPKFDIVLASGVLHHMDDEVAFEFLRLAHEALKPGGRLVTIDPCWVPGQNLVARFLIARDRGQNVRTEAGYEELVRSVFGNVKVTVRHKAWIPYTHCFTECTRA
jgi:SAM-dependent methyltransferase